MVAVAADSGGSGGDETNLLEEEGPCVSCTTFNILAPIYKRLDQKNQSLRESDDRGFWLARNQMILDWLLYERSSIICLQEFWVGNEELVHMYLDGLSDAGYVTFQLPRTNNRGDGLLTAIKEDHFRVLNHRELLFNDFGDRVAQLLHVQLIASVLKNMECADQQELLIVNTHLLFPHDSSLSLVRLHQVYKILQYVETYQQENKLNKMPVILCGDWNGSKRGHVYKFLRSQGFVSSYDIAHQYTDNDADAHKWVSHRNHRGNICGVDFIWLRNPIKLRKTLKTSWAEAVFGIIKFPVQNLVHTSRIQVTEFANLDSFLQYCTSWYGFACAYLKYRDPQEWLSGCCDYQLLKKSLVESNAFALMKAENHGDYTTYSGFFEALQQINLVGRPYGLSFQETKDLWAQADVDGNGAVDYAEFKQRIWNSVCEERQDDYCNDKDLEHVGTGNEEGAVGFLVKDAVLFPREAERGMWPEDYSLSDHARLTAVFSPVIIRCSGQ